MDAITTYLQRDVPPAIAALALPAVRLRPMDLAPMAPPRGGHRLGGRPDWPAERPWPRWRNAAMDFILQVDLAAIAGLPGTDVLPPTGLLSFFYSAYRETWGFSPQDAGSWAVVHLAEPRSALTPRWCPPDDDLDEVYADFTAVAAPEWTLPSSICAQAQALAPTPDARQAYLEVEMHLIRHYDTDRGSSHLLGHAAQFQSQDLAAACAATAPDGAAEGPWRLLLQFCPPDHWGFAGVLYYFIRDADLAARRFDRTWVLRED